MAAVSTSVLPDDPYQMDRQAGPAAEARPEDTAG
jgi:hypothetical protein